VEKHRVESLHPVLLYSRIHQLASGEVFLQYPHLTRLPQIMPLQRQEIIHSHFHHALLLQQSEQADRLDPSNNAG
jgi:hypothetical protein